MSNPSADTSLPTCPRHPDQVSFVTCQRCERPTCAQCQRPAAVGIQCVDCVKQSSKDVPRQVSLFGGRMAQGRPVVTIGLIAVCVVVWLGQMVHSSITYDLAYSPWQTGSEPWRMLTSAFVHSPDTVFHIAFNMYALWICGQYLEPLLGRARFFALYLISAFGGSVCYELLASLPTRTHLSSGWLTPTLGASGAVFGLFVTVLVLNRHLGREVGSVIALIVINGAIGFLVPNIAWQDHLGGAITGGVCAAAIVLLGRERRNLQWAALTGVVVLLVVIAVVRYRTVDLPFTITS